MVNGANDGQLVHHLGLLSHQFTKKNAGHVGFHRAEGAAIFGGSLRLGIVGLKLGRATGKLNINHRCLAGGSAILFADPRARLKKLRQS